MKKLKILIFLLLIGLVAALLPAQSRAATGSIYISPSSKSVSKNSSFTSYVRISPGTAVDSVETNINYDNSKLQATSVVCSTAAFGLTVRCNISAGQIQITEGKIGGTVSSDSLLATITFKALAGSGSTNLTQSGANAAHSGGYTNPSSPSAYVSFYTPTSSSPPASSGGNTTTSSSPAASDSASGSANTDTKQKVSLKVTVTVALGKIQFTQAILNVNTNIDSQVSVLYGVDQKSLASETAYTAFSKHHSISIGNTKLTPGTTYYYKVLTKDKNGKVSAHDIEQFKTKGFSLSLTVLGKDYQPLVKQKVTLHSDPLTATTDSKGIVTFNNVSPGDHSLQYNYNGINISQPVYVQNKVSRVAGIEAANVQEAAIILPVQASQIAKSQTYNTVTYISISAALAMFVLLITDISPLGPKLRSKLYSFFHKFVGQPQ